MALERPAGTVIVVSAVTTTRRLTTSPTRAGETKTGSVMTSGANNEDAVNSTPYSDGNKNELGQQSRSSPMFSTSVYGTRPTICVAVAVTT